LAESNKHRALYAAGILLAVWFLLTSWVWVYYANIFFSLPAGIAAYFIRRYLVTQNYKPERIISVILLLGISSAVISLLAHYIGN